MSDMTIKEIEKLLDFNDDILLGEQACGNDERAAHLARLAFAIRQLLEERRWRPLSELPDHLKDGRTIIIGGGAWRSLPWSDAAFWHDGSQCHPGRGEAGLFAESDRGNLLTARNVTGEVFMELPLPPSPEEENGDA